MATSVASEETFSLGTRRVRRVARASMVALERLIGLGFPKDLVMISLTPASSMMALMVAPATTPVPTTAGLRRTREA